MASPRDLGAAPNWRGRSTDIIVVATNSQSTAPGQISQISVYSPDKRKKSLGFSRVLNKKKDEISRYICIPKIVHYLREVLR